MSHDRATTGEPADEYPRSDAEFQRLFHEWAADQTISRWDAVTVEADRLEAQRAANERGGQ